MHMCYSALQAVLTSWSHCGGDRPYTHSEEVQHASKLVIVGIAVFNVYTYYIQLCMCA